MCAIDTSEMNWLESKGNFSRYDTMTEDEESIWVCEDCGEEADPDDDHDCVVIDRLESSWNGSHDDVVDEEEEEIPHGLQQPDRWAAPTRVFSEAHP